MSEPRDYTKYRFDGEVLGKGRLVLALVKRYVADHPGITMAQLEEAFPARLQADSPTQFSPMRTVVARLRDVPQEELRRFFVGPGETGRLESEEIAVSREWNRDNIQNVLAQAAKLGYSVEVV